MKVKPMAATRPPMPPVKKGVSLRPTAAGEIPRRVIRPATTMTAKTATLPTVAQLPPPPLLRDSPKAYRAVAASAKATVKVRPSRKVGREPKTTSTSSRRGIAANSAKPMA